MREPMRARAISVTALAGAVAAMAVSPVAAETAAVPRSGAVTGPGGRAVAAHTAPEPESTQQPFAVRLADPHVAGRDPRALRSMVDHLKPGATVEHQVEVFNSTRARQVLELYPADAKIKGNRFVFSPGRTSNELTGWVTVTPSTLSLAPGQKAKAKVKLVVPATASTGERYAELWVQRREPAAAGAASASSAPSASSAASASTSTASSTPSSASTVSAAPASSVAANGERTGIRMYVHVGKGAEPPSAFEVGSYRVHRSEAGVPVLTAQVRNTGGRALDLSGTLELTEGPGLMSAGPFPIQPGTTLPPGGIGTVSAGLDPVLPDGPWDVTLGLESGKTKREVSANLTLPRNRDPWLAQLGRLPDPTTMFAGTALLIVASGLGSFALGLRRAQRKSQQRQPRDGT
ncbi:hypothetical protein [Streptomyces sp. NPDC127084]|uniref:hypothetical protein n=1 Tax=Streptomyces sp. NPDC127084 TaxID=3347133 RepID=UPI00364702D7